MAVPALSIIIPALGRVELLERGLVSVLANRPADCEVLVVLNDDYDDPYDLTDEVRFINAPQGAGWAESIAAGLAAASADVVHLLAPGSEVEEGWTEPALAHFDDPQVAAVAPWISTMSAKPAKSIVGVRYRAAGLRRLHKVRRWGRERARKKLAGKSILGPVAEAGFWRRALLDELLPPSAEAVGDELADVDVALCLGQLGYRALIEPDSRVTLSTPIAAPPTTFGQSLRRARRAERLFWRHAAQIGRLRSALVHPLVLLDDLLAAGPRGALVARWLGRTAALFELRAYRQHRQRMSELATPQPFDTAGSAHQRYDAPHGAVTAPAQAYCSSTGQTSNHSRPSRSIQALDSAGPQPPGS